MLRGEREADGITGESAEKLLDSRDEYTAEGVFWVPPEARWQYLKERAKQPEIGKLVPAVNGFDEGLTGRLRTVAESHGVGPNVMYRPLIGHRDRGAGYLHQLLDFTNRLIIGDQHDPAVWTHSLANDPNTSVIVR